MKLVLASSSPARTALLQRLKIDFVTHAPDIDETPLDNESPEQMVQRLSLLKAQAVASQHPEALIIGSDCVGELNGNQLTKPLSKDNAAKQLKLMSGQQVRFVTGLCLLNAADSHYQLSFEEYFVQYRQLTEQQIKHYLHKAPDDILYCAGCFQAEQFGISLVKRFSGRDFTSLIGLPLIHLIDFLKNFDVEIL